MGKCTVRKTGTPSRPWEARCRDCFREGEKTYIVQPFGALGFNTRGMGNRLWVLAMLAVQEHLRRGCYID